MALPVDLKRIDERRFSPDAAEIRAVMVVRNELRRLPSVLSHHRQLGVDRFLVVDNNSTDGTVDYLLAQEDAIVFETTASYQAARLGIDWIEHVLSAYCDGLWCLILDGDEHFVYPDHDHLPMPAFCASLEQRGLDCLATLFVDLYSDRPILETKCNGQPLLQLCPFFDSEGYYSFPAAGFATPRFYGGPRARVFWPEMDLRGGGHVQGSVERAFDEAGYLALHPDVRSAVTDGVVESGLDHFMRYGHIEGRAVVIRHVPEWPEKSYLRVNPDVTAAIRSGVLASGLEHYVRYGQFEARGIVFTGPPCLSQVPLIRWNSRIRLDVGRHRVTGTAWRRHNAVGGALLHFKLMADLVNRANEVTQAPPNESEPAWSSENQRYYDVLRLNPRLTCMGPSSVRYRDARQLLELGIVQPVSKL